MVQFRVEQLRIGLFRVAVASLALAVVLSTNQAEAAAVVITDDVEASGDYTHVGTGSAGISVSAGGFGLPSVVGANYVFLSSGAADAQSGSVTFDAGFGPLHTIAAGTYTLSVSVGETNTGRDPFETFEGFLQTTGGTELTGRSEPIGGGYSVPGPSTWQTTVDVQYTVAAGDVSLIGQEFTWGFDYTKTGTANPFLAGFDGVSVNFSAAVIPEPSSFALLGLGIFGFCAKRRNRRS